MMTAQNAPPAKRDMRFKFAKIQVLLVDANTNSATLVQSILVAFGIRKIDIVKSPTEAMQMLRSRRVDIIICEFEIVEPRDGLTFVRAIRGAKSDKLLRHDTAILMLTAHSEKHNVAEARDAGITEFVAKPFSARTLSSRIIDIIDNPREFVDSPKYCGPNRRRRGKPPIGVAERRTPRGEGTVFDPAMKVTVSRASNVLRDLLDGANAGDIISEEVIMEAQAELMKAESEFVVWIRDDIGVLERCYENLASNMSDDTARRQLVKAAYNIKGQSGTFGYAMGTEVADLLITYLDQHDHISENVLLVVRKHLDTMIVLFTQKVKDTQSELGMALLDSLRKLTLRLR